MWLLGCVLPLIIGDYVPDDDEHWLLFLRLMEVVDLLFAPKLTRDYVAYLSALISVITIMILVGFIQAIRLFPRCTLWCICLDS